MGTWKKQGILKGRIINGQYIHEEVVKKEMQIKATLRFLLTLVRKARIEGNNNNKCWWGCGKTGALIYCWWEWKLVQPLWKIVWRFLRKLERELPHDPVTVLLDIYPKGHKTGYGRDTCTPMFTTALFTITKIWTQHRYPTTDEWIIKLWLYIHNGVLPSDKEQWYEIWKQMDAIRGHYVKWSKPESETQKNTLLVGM
jgi:hypothetical protein